MTTPKLAMPELSVGQAGKELTHNQALAILDQLAQAVVVDKDLATPPGSPANGAMYIVAAAATGAWAGKSGNLAFWLTSVGAWTFAVPVNGWSVWVTDEAVRYELLAGVWTIVSTGVVSAAQGINRLINGNPLINQRGVTGTVVLSAGIYGHDRWKAGASGCTYTFATTANVTTITITAGSLQQVIEGVNLQSGTHVLSWSGTAQGKIGAGSYGASGITGGVVGGTNLTIEFNIGTLSFAQFEPGSVSTNFEHRMQTDELFRCRRFYRVYGSFRASLYAAGPSTIQVPMPIEPPMRSSPAITIGTISTAVNASVIGMTIESSSSAFWTWNSASAGQSYWAIDSIIMSAEL